MSNDVRIIDGNGGQLIGPAGAVQPLREAAATYWPHAECGADLFREQPVRRAGRLLCPQCGEPVPGEDLQPVAPNILEELQVPGYLAAARARGLTRQEQRGLWALEVKAFLAQEKRPAAARAVRETAPRPSIELRRALLRETIQRQVRAGRDKAAIARQLVEQAFPAVWETYLPGIPVTVELRLMEGLDGVTQRSGDGFHVTLRPYPNRPFRALETALHEVAHVALGHLRRTPAAARYTDREVLAGVLRRQLNPAEAEAYQLREAAADDWARREIDYLFGPGA